MVRSGKALHTLVGRAAIWVPEMSGRSREKSAESWDPAMQVLWTAGAAEHWLRRSSAGKDFQVLEADSGTGINSEDGRSSHSEQYYCTMARPSKVPSAWHL